MNRTISLAAISASVLTATLALAQECGDLDSSGQIAATDALLLLRAAVGEPGLPALECPVLPLPVLPATAQTLCYDSEGTEIDCAGTGQDGELQKGAARSFTDNGNGTVTDDSFGLMWEKFADDGSIHDQDNYYTWDSAFTIKVATLNSTRFAGYDDWRVPNRLELETLVDNSTTSPPATYSEFEDQCVPGCTVLTCSCSGTQSFWSSTSLSGNPAWAWGVNFPNGFVGHGIKGESFNVRAVRGG